MSLTTDAAADVAWPADALAAVTHPDPYPYYARLVAERPLHWDEGLGAWVAASAEAVAAVLESPACRVRPPAEPVPGALLGSPAAEIFGRLVRMNDGVEHARLKPAVAMVLGDLDLAAVDRLADQRAAAGVDRLAPQSDPAALTRFCFAVPVEVMADLLGLPNEPELPALVDAYVRAASPLADPAEVAEGKAAAGRLLAIAGEALDRQACDGEPTLLRALAEAATALGAGERATVLANGVGFLSQAYEATAALIGATLVALGRHEAALAQVRRRPELLADAVQETLRWDPSTQNMRRFVGEDAHVGGVAMKAGDRILALSAAASRDVALNPDPERFDIFRQRRTSVGFGAGPHACPAHGLAPAIAVAAIRRLLAAGLEPSGLERVRSFRRSAFRIPVFG